MKKSILGIVLCLLLLTGCIKDDRSKQQSSSQSGSSTSVSSTGLSESGSAGEASQPQQVETFKLVIPEGYTLARIGMTLEEQGVCTAKEFIAASQSGDFSEFSLIAAQQPNENRCFALEGYLFPATYDIRKDATPDQIIRQLLATTESRFTEALRNEIAQSGYTTDQILAMASIIEKEAFGLDVMPIISSVIHNRLQIGMRVECDPTITYVEGAIKPFIEGDVNRYNEHYNTYKCPALPAGPICNPSMAAIEAALRPADTGYLYFVVDTDKNFYFGTTLEEHEANCKTAGIEGY